MSKNTRIQNDTVVELITIATDAEATSCSRWNKTGQLVAENEEMFFSGDLDKKARAKAFTKLLDDGCDLDSIPESGDSRQGEEILLRKKNNKIKWSSWTVTARLVQNTSDIWKGLEELGSDIVFPDGEIISRYELLNLLKEADSKPGETPAETIARCMELIAKKCKEVEVSEVDAVEVSFGIGNMAWSDQRVALGI